MTSPLQYDQAAAEASRFGKIVVQCGITSAILNPVVAEKLAGLGTVFLHVELGVQGAGTTRDIITGRVEVIAAREDTPITELETTSTRGDGAVVLDGTAVCLQPWTSTMAAGQ